MGVDITELDAHEQPSEELKAQWKAYSKTDQKELLAGADIDDLASSESRKEFQVAGTVPAERLNNSFKHLLEGSGLDVQVHDDAPIYFHPLLPGRFLDLSVRFYALG